MDNKSKNKGKREDKEVCTTSVGIETTMSRLWNKASKHHNRCFEGSKHWYKRLKVIKQRTIKGSPEEDSEGNLVQQSEHY